MIIDQSGDLATMTRHDYLPFGEELFAGTGGRTTGIGYAGSDGVRQQFTSQERDPETALDYFHSRYYSATQGRFTSPDPENAGSQSTNPQSWNAYTYVLNNPQRYTDPFGLAPVCKINGEVVSCETVINNIRTGNFRVTTIRVNGKAITVRRSDFEKVTQSQKADGTLVSTISFNETAFLRAAAVLANTFQQAVLEHEKKTAFDGGFGGGDTFSGGGAGSCFCESQNLKYVGASYHGDKSSGDKSAAPTNGQAGLDNSVQVKETSPRRVGVDTESGRFVVYDQTRPGEFHGHVRYWHELRSEMQNALVKAGLATRNGKIITTGGAK
jgi:RHS repeat-associated protein